MRKDDDRMADFLMNVYAWITIGAFVAVLIDKLFEGSMEWLFYLASLLGPWGATIACFLFRHHTSSGGVAVPIVFSLIHFGVFKLIDKIF